ncbi:MAG: serine O-acetyltransferase [Planctomycetota bacterium]|jgi:serine O-acetyltransferase
MVEPLLEESSAPRRSDRDENVAASVDGDNGRIVPTAIGVPLSTPDGVCRATEFPMNGSRNQNPAGMGLWALFREDLRTHGIFFSQGLWALSVNRFGNWRMDRNKLVRILTRPMYMFAYRLVHWITRLELPYIVKCGRRVRIWHHGGCVLGACEIGDDVQIRHNITFGLSTHGDPIHQLPIIEDRVIIGAGAAIVGPIRIGHDSIVGANAVVTKDVPPYSLVAGIPAKVIRKLEEKPLLTHVETKV